MADRVRTTKQSLEKHVESDDNALSSSYNELEGCVRKLEMRLGEDSRWVYMGDDLELTDTAGRDARMTLLEDIKILLKKFRLWGPVLKCSQAIREIENILRTTKGFKNSIKQWSQAMVSNSGFNRWSQTTNSEIGLRQWSQMVSKNGYHPAVR